ncbi:MAG: leucine-rich repeat domain-containing protein [Bacteroidaceae bacterium]|nr:leucine-rich repeat domain-containing protein [Bacteroidaceae bacterium]
MKKILLTLFTLVFALNVAAQSRATSGNCGNISWSIEGTTMTISAISGNGKMDNHNSTDEVPWLKYTYNPETQTITYPAVAVKKIIVKNGVTHIGSYCFANMYSLTEVELPSSLSSIGGNAFNNSSNLQFLTGECDLDKIKKISSSVFSGTQIINKSDGALYIGNKLVLVYTESYNATSIEVRSGTTEICADAFNENENLQSITIPASVTKIGNNAFSGCTNLSIFNLNGNNVTFGSNVFIGCTNLPSDGTYRKAGDKIIVEVVDTYNENYKIPSGIIYIAENAFTKCENIQTIESYESTPALGTNALSNSLSPYLYVTDGQESKFYGKGIADNRINHTVINLHSSGYSTIALKHSANIPDGIEAYTVTTDGNQIYYKRVYKLAKEQGYFIVGSGNTTFKPAKTEILENNSNDLVGVLEDQTINGSNYYILSTKSSTGVTGFYCLGNNNYKFPAGKAYLYANGVKNAQYFLINLDETETGIENTEEESNKNARSDIYNLAGQKLSKTQKGLNVVNGKLTIM